MPAALRRLFHVFAADDAASSAAGRERVVIDPAAVREALASTGGGYCRAADSKEGECKKEGFEEGACPRSATCCANACRTPCHDQNLSSVGLQALRQRFRCSCTCGYHEHGFDFRVGTIACPQHWIC